MDNDLILILGLGILAFAVPAVVSAFSDSRPPRGGAVLAMLGLALVGYAVMRKPGGYPLGEIPTVFLTVLGRLLN